MGAVTRAPIGVLRSLPQTRQMLQQVMQEVFEVAQAHGTALPQDIVRKTLTGMDGLPPSATASMQRDILEGRPSELEAQMAISYFRKPPYTQVKTTWFLWYHAPTVTRKRS